MLKRKIDDTKNNICFRLRNRQTTGVDKDNNFLKLIEPAINTENKINFKYFLSINDYENNKIQDKIKDEIGNKPIYYLTINEKNNKIVLIKIYKINLLDYYDEITETQIYEYSFIHEQDMHVKSKYILKSSLDDICVSDIDLLNSLYTDGINYYYIPTDIILSKENKEKFIKLLKLSSLKSIDFIFKNTETRRRLEQQENEEELRRNLEEIAEFQGGKNNKNKEKTRVIYTDIDNKGKKYKYINYKKERYIITNKDIKKQYIIINKIRINIVNKQK